MGLPMKYRCLDCGYTWSVAKLELRLGYRRCPKCRSYDTVPEGFEEMVEKGRKLGISQNTPFLDIAKAFSAVWEKYRIYELGWFEFRRVMKRVIQECEKGEK